MEIKEPHNSDENVSRELEPWVQPWTVVKISAYQAEAAEHNQKWGVITKVQKLDQPTFPLTIENIKDTIFYFNPNREPYKSFFVSLTDKERVRFIEKSTNTPEQALDDASKSLEPALAQLEVAVWIEPERYGYTKIEIYDSEVKFPIASLTQKLWPAVSDEDFKEARQMIKDVLEKETRDSEQVTQE